LLLKQKRAFSVCRQKNNDFPYDDTRGLWLEIGFAGGLRQNLPQKTIKIKG
jgi:hypothetical protein